MNELEGAKVKMIDLDSDKFQCYNHRDKLNGTVQLTNPTPPLKLALHYHSCGPHFITTTDNQAKHSTYCVGVILCPWIIHSYPVVPLSP